MIDHRGSYRLKSDGRGVPVLNRRNEICSKLFGQS